MITPHPRARATGMVPNGAKVREAILHIIHETDARDRRVTQFDILKTLFLADRSHLNKYGRPITFDEYVAMKDGPVPSLAYDVLKGALGGLREAEIEKPLWVARPAGARSFHFMKAARQASEDILSESDIEELNEALTLVLKLGYNGTWKKVHADPAYIKVWGARGERNQVPIDPELLLDRPHEHAGRDLKFLSAHS